MNTKQKHYLAKQRAKRVRGKMSGTAERPRLSVFRSNKFIYVQAIDDAKGVVVAVANELQLAKKNKKALTGTKIERAQEVATVIAAQLKTKKISKVCFDRGSNRFHGRVKAIADTVRAAGIEV
jgi:large subunit ribosomal protein L18